MVSPMLMARMTDDDRLADYVARIENPDHTRTLDDGCTSCGHSLVFCRCNRYMDLGPCCPNCDGHQLPLTTAPH